MALGEFPEGLEEITESIALLLKRELFHLPEWEKFIMQLTGLLNVSADKIQVALIDAFIICGTWGSHAMKPDFDSYYLFFFSRPTFHFGKITGSVKEIKEFASQFLADLPLLLKEELNDGLKKALKTDPVPVPFGLMQSIFKARLAATIQESATSGQNNQPLAENLLTSIPDLDRQKPVYYFYPDASGELVDLTLNLFLSASIVDSSGTQLLEKDFRTEDIILFKRNLKKIFARRSPGGIAKEIKALIIDIIEVYDSRRPSERTIAEELLADLTEEELNMIVVRRGDRVATVRGFCKFILCLKKSIDRLSKLGLETCKEFLQYALNELRKGRSNAFMDLSDLVNFCISLSEDDLDRRQLSGQVRELFKLPFPYLEGCSIED